jgi:nucleotide-binding universal stress UspA family protein
MNTALLALLLVAVLGCAVAGVVPRRRRPSDDPAPATPAPTATTRPTGPARPATDTALSGSVRRAGRVVVGVSGSLGSLAALRHACRLARRDRAKVLAVLAWTPPGGELAYRQAPCPSLSTMWERQATLRLMDAFDAALGGFPRDVTVEPVVLRAPAAEALTTTADRQDDLLVVGGTPGGLPTRLLHGAVRRRVLAHAACPVLAVRPPTPPRGALRALRHADPTDFLPEPD